MGHANGHRPYHWSVRLALALVLVSLLAGCGPSFSPSATVNSSDPGASGAASPPRVAPPPITPPTAPGTNLPDFACADFKGGKTGVANFTAARAGEQQGYDRFVLQFDAIVPTYTVTRQAKPVFTQGAGGQVVTLHGTSGVLVSVFSATGNVTFTGSNDIVHPEFQILAEAREVQDFEGHVQWGLGLNKPSCMRVFVLSDPARLVVDLQIPSS